VADDSGEAEPRLPQREASINQLIAFNMAAFRKAAGLTQKQLGERLGGWSEASVSAAERSWDGKRVRQFDADEIVAIAAVLGVPVIALLLPPPDAWTATDYTFTATPAPVSPMDAPGLLAHLYLFPGPGEAVTQVMAVFRERLIALAASRLLFPLADQIVYEARERARLERESARAIAEAMTDDAQARAESLEYEAQAMTELIKPLIDQRIALEQRINDLRAFERASRSRLLAYLEDRVRELKAGAPDSLTSQPPAGPDG
jgi:transcriptional regulator with XRE-family HTH domain